MTLNNALTVLRNNGALSLSLLRRVPVPGVGTSLLSADPYLIAAAGSGAVILGASAAERGETDVVRGTLTSPHGSGAVSALLSQGKLSHGNQYLFVTLHNSDDVAVFDFGSAQRSRFTASHLVGLIPLGVQPAGQRLSPNGQWLYVIGSRRTAGNVPAQGTLSVISVPAAETDPATAVKATVNAGCDPARVLTNGNTVWVTASGSNALLAFSASALLQDRSHALLADVPIGPAPVGMTLVTRDQLVIADSNETSQNHGSGNLTVINMSSALAGKQAVLSVIPVDGQPYQLIQTEQNATLVVTDRNTGQLLTLKIADLP